MTEPSRRVSRDNALAGAASPLGGSLFSIGAFLAQIGAELTTVNITYLVGGLLLQPRRLDCRSWSRGRRRRARRSAVVLFVGTLLFAVSLVAAFAEGLTPRQSNSWIWFPDILGCVCFLVSGTSRMLDVGRRPGPDPRPATSDWWIVAVNQVGSVLFFLAGVAAFIRPATSRGDQRRPGQLGDVRGGGLLRGRRTHPYSAEAHRRHARWSRSTDDDIFQLTTPRPRRSSATGS